MIWMTMNLKKDFIFASFNHRLFALPAFRGLFFIGSSPFGELSYYTIKAEPKIMALPFVTTNIFISPSYPAIARLLSEAPISRSDT